MVSLWEVELLKEVGHRGHILGGICLTLTLFTFPISAYFLSAVRSAPVFLHILSMMGSWLSNHGRIPWKL